MPAHCCTLLCGCTQMLVSSETGSLTNRRTQGHYRHDCLRSMHRVLSNMDVMQASAQSQAILVRFRIFNLQTAQVFQVWLVLLTGAQLGNQSVYCRYLHRSPSRRTKEPQSVTMPDRSSTHSPLCRLLEAEQQICGAAFRDDLVRSLPGICVCYTPLDSLQ